MKLVEERTKQWVENVSDCSDNEFNDANLPKTVAKSSDGQNVMLPLPHLDQNSAVFNYLERQERNEYINLASQIGYNGRNIAFVFYENQIRKLMMESPH